LEYAKALGVPRLNCLAGILPAGVSQQEATQTFIGHLNYAAPLLADAGIKLLIEPINTYDIPGFFLSTSPQAIDILMSVQSNNVYLQYDAYHMHRMGEDILAIEDLMPFIDHIQIADHPGRHEPGTGEIPFAEFFELLDDLDYSGWVGCEYLEKNRAKFWSD
jgi:hydroxypyruvate isomerase